MSVGVLEDYEIRDLRAGLVAVHIDSDGKKRRYRFLLGTSRGTFLKGGVSCRPRTGVLCKIMNRRIIVFFG
jgi:hypothetical protein